MEGREEKEEREERENEFISKREDREKWIERYMYVCGEERDSEGGAQPPGHSYSSGGDEQVVPLAALASLSSCRGQCQKLVEYLK